MAKMTGCLTNPKLRTLFTEKELRDIMGAKDAKMFINDKLKFIKDNKRRKYLQVLAYKRNANQMPTTDKEIGQWLGGIIGQSRSQSWRTGLENQSFALMAKMHRDLIDLMEMAAPKKFGWTIQHGVHDDIVRAIKGESASPEAMAVAKSWTDADKIYMEMFNDSGGHTKMRSDWDLPTTHDPVLVGKVSPEEYRDFILPLLDFGRMATTEARMRDWLPSAHKRISTDGAIDLDPLKGAPASQRGAMSNRHSQQRFFVFKDADSWIKYQRKFGNTNIYGAMMEHLHVLSKEITAMQVFGPNAELGFKSTIDEAIKRTGNVNIGRKATDQWNLHMGHTSPVNSRAAGAGAEARNWMNTILLPSAIFSAVSDPAWAITFSRMRGIPVFSNVQFAMKAMAMNVTDRPGLNKIMAELYLGAERLLDASHSSSRYSDVVGSGVSARSLEVMLRVTGLNPWTVVWKAGHGMAMSRLIERGKYPKRFKELMLRYGITQEDMDLVAKAKRIDRMGVKFVNWDSVPVETMTKFVGMMRGNTHFAVPEPDITTRAAMVQSTRAGSGVGEAIRFGGQLKSHPFHVLLGNINEISRSTSGHQRMEALAETFVLTWLFAVIGQQAYEVVRGRELMDWDEPELWGKAFVRAGGAGIISDIFLQDHERYGNFFKGAAGPVPAAVYDHILAGMIGPLWKMKNGEFEEEGKKLLANMGQAAVDLDPFARIPYTRAVWEQYVSQTILKLTDKDAAKKLRRKERNRVKEFGNKSFLR